MVLQQGYLTPGTPQLCFRRGTGKRLVASRNAHQIKGGIIVAVVLTVRSTALFPPPGGRPCTHYKDFRVESSPTLMPWRLPSNSHLSKVFHEPSRRPLSSSSSSWEYPLPTFPKREGRGNVGGGSMLSGWLPFSRVQVQLITTPLGHSDTQ